MTSREGQAVTGLRPDSVMTDEANGASAAGLDCKQLGCDEAGLTFFFFFPLPTFLICFVTVHLHISQQVMLGCLSSFRKPNYFHITSLGRPLLTTVPPLVGTFDSPRCCSFSHLCLGFFFSPRCMWFLFPLYYTNQQLASMLLVDAFSKERNA